MTQSPSDSTPQVEKGAPYLLLSGDCHAGPPLPGFAPYFDPEYREEFDRYWRARPAAAALESAIQGDLEALANSLGLFMQATGASEEMANSFSERALRLTGGLFDSKVRNACLDEEGIAGEVIYPDGFCENHPPVTDGQDESGALFSARKPFPFATRLAGARAYNRWLADFCAESPERRAGVILLPPAHDIPALVEEMTRAREAGLRGGVLVPPLDSGLPGYHDPYYAPLWSAAEDLNLPIAVHGGDARAADGHDVYGTEEPLASFLHFTESTFLDRRPLWHFIWGGVFDRHPKLRLVFAEALAHWVPQELTRLDEMYDMWNSKMIRDRLRKRPSDYWRSQCAITATFASRGEVEMRDQIGVGNFLWGSDYPHPEGTWPYTETCLRHAFHGVAENETRRMLGDNALDFYGFDPEAMARLANAIGPRPDEVIHPPEARPTDYVGMGLR